MQATSLAECPKCGKVFAHVHHRGRCHKCEACGTMLECGRGTCRDLHPPSTFNEADCGGTFDGFSVSSDADPGL